MSMNRNGQPVLQIKKYPNRRYYDATRSCHVTLQELYDLIRAGHDVCVTDSRTGEDITNLILFQVLLEKDQPKLDLLPSSVLHLMIRSNRQALRAMSDAFFGPFIKMYASSQRQFENYVRNAMSGKLTNPLDWANEMFRMFSPGGPPAHEQPLDAYPEPPPPDETPPSVDELNDLRRQIADLTRQIEGLQDRGPGGE